MHLLSYRRAPLPRVRLCLTPLPHEEHTAVNRRLCTCPLVYQINVPNVLIEEVLSIVASVRTLQVTAFIVLEQNIRKSQFRS